MVRTGSLRERILNTICLRAPVGELTRTVTVARLRSLAFLNGQPLPLHVIVTTEPAGAPRTFSDVKRV